jgi:hypothetical protein
MLKKHIRPIALILTVVMIVSIISITTGGFGLLNVKAEQTEALEQTDAGDMKIAGDISNLTGIDVNTILNMKNDGLSWNEVLKELEDINTDSEKNRSDRDNVLLTKGLGEAPINQLKNEGFSKEELIDAPIPKIDSVIPENPADALMNEIKNIDPMIKN